MSNDRITKVVKASVRQGIWKPFSLELQPNRVAEVEGIFSNLPVFYWLNI